MRDIKKFIESNKDKKIKDIGYGLYKYKVRMSVLDPTVSALTGIINTMTKTSSNIADDGVISLLTKYSAASLTNKKFWPRYIPNPVSAAFLTMSKIGNFLQKAV